MPLAGLSFRACSLSFQAVNGYGTRIFGEAFTQTVPQRQLALSGV